MKKKLVILAVLCMSVWAFAACGAKKEEVDIIPTNAPTETPAAPTNTPTEVPVTPTSEATPTPEATSTVTPTPTAVPRMVEGYDIGPATNGTALKDGFEKYFKIGTALN